ncbi:MAG TPA: helix-turn-helix domain-containing protein, partial [Pyrinomonadaceae bacterium]
DAMNALRSYAWPGNVREMENCIERAVVLSGDQIDLESLPSKIRNAAGLPAVSSDGSTLEAVERRHILETLSSNDGDKVSAARQLGIDLSTLYRKLKRYDES